MLDYFYLNGNPFQKNQVVDVDDFNSQPFIPLKSISRLKLEIEFAYPTEDPRLFYSFIGRRGIGKTSIVLFLKKSIESLNSINGKKPLAIYINKNYDKMTEDGYFTLYYLLFNEPSPNTSPPKKEVEDELIKYTHIYWLFDMPDELRNKDHFRMFARLLDFILRNKYGSVFIAMNQNHYIELSKITNIIGESAKITTFNLLYEYDEELMLKIALERIKQFRSNGFKGNEFYPFDIKALQVIAKDSNFIPRNFIIGCRTCLFKAYEEKINLINIEVVEEVLKPEFAKKIIESKVSGLAERAIYLNIINCIKRHFKNEADDHAKLYDKLKTKYDFKLNYASLTKKIKDLHDWGIVSVEKNFETPRGQKIKLVL